MTCLFQRTQTVLQFGDTPMPTIATYNVVHSYYIIFKDTIAERSLVPRPLSEK